MKVLSVVVMVGVFAVGATALAEEKKSGPAKTAPAIKKAADAKATPAKAPAAPAAAKAAAPAKAAEPAKAPVAPAATKVAAPATAPAAASGELTVEAKVCKNLQNREPVDITDSFKIADGQVITFSRVTGGTGSEIHHVYFHGDKQVDDITLKVKGSPWRTNSRKTLRPDVGMSGDWRVEVRDGGGAVLETLKFSVE